MHIWSTRSTPFLKSLRGSDSQTTEPLFHGWPGWWRPVRTTLHLSPVLIAAGERRWACPITQAIAVEVVART